MKAVRYQSYGADQVIDHTATRLPPLMEKMT
jgi:hypothetical protein